MPEESVCGEQTDEQSDVSGTGYQGPPKPSNRKMDRKQDDNEEQPQAKKKKASENVESKYKYESLRMLSDKLEEGQPLQQRNILAVVEQVLEVGTADEEGFCQNMKEGRYVFQIGDVEKNGVLARICPMQYNPKRKTLHMKLGPCMKIGDVIRIHRATVQFEDQYGENQMVISTTPHYNYALFDGSKSDDEMMVGRGLALNPTPLSEREKATVKKLWEHWSRRTMDMEPEVEVVTLEEFSPEVAQEPLSSPSKFARGAESVSSSAPVSSAINNETCSKPMRPRRSPRKLTSPPGRLHVVHEKNSQDVPESQATLIDPDPAANIRDPDVEEDPMITDVQEVQDLLTSDEDSEPPLEENQTEEGPNRRKAFNSAKLLHVRTKLPLRSSGSYIVKYANALKEIPVKLLKDMNFELDDGASYNLFGKIVHFWMRSHKNTYTLYIDFTDKTTSEYHFLYCNKDGSEGEGNAETVQIEVLIEKHERALIEEVSMKSALPALLMNVRRISSANLSKLQTTISNVMFIQSLR